MKNIPFESYSNAKCVALLDFDTKLLIVNADKLGFRNTLPGSITCINESNAVGEIMSKHCRYYSLFHGCAIYIGIYISYHIITVSVTLPTNTNAVPTWVCNHYSHEIYCIANHYQYYNAVPTCVCNLFNVILRQYVRDATIRLHWCFLEIANSPHGKNNDITSHPPSRLFQVWFCCIYRHPSG